MKTLADQILFIPYTSNPTDVHKLMPREWDKLTIPEMIMFTTLRWDGYQPNDRTGTFVNRYKRYTPELKYVQGNFNKDINDIIDERAKELVDLGKKIIVAWSGGLDSTSALVAIIKACGNNLDQLKVLGDVTSIKEHPTFFEKQIKGRQIEHQFVEDYWPYYARPNEDEIIVTGDGVPQNLGPTGISFLEDRYKPWQDYMSKYFDIKKNNKPDPLYGYVDGEVPIWQKLTTPHHGHLSRDVNLDDFFEAIDPWIKKSPKEVKTIADYYWWATHSIGCYNSQYTFIARQHKEYSKEMFNRIHCFFWSDDFTYWSQTIPSEVLFGNSTWEYKKILRDYIYEYDNDSEYYNRKYSMRSGQTYNPGNWDAYMNDHFPFIVDSDHNHFMYSEVRKNPFQFFNILNLIPPGQYFKNGYLQR